MLRRGKEELQKIDKVTISTEAPRKRLVFPRRTLEAATLGFIRAVSSSFLEYGHVIPHRVWHHCRQ